MNLISNLHLSTKECNKKKKKRYKHKKDFDLEIAFLIELIFPLGLGDIRKNEQFAT